jgi:hypothetical protein
MLFVHEAVIRAGWKPSPERGAEASKMERARRTVWPYVVASYYKQRCRRNVLGGIYARDASSKMNKSMSVIAIVKSSSFLPKCYVAEQSDRGLRGCGGEKKKVSHANGVTRIQLISQLPKRCVVLWIKLISGRARSRLPRCIIWKREDNSSRGTSLNLYKGVRTQHLRVEIAPSDNFFVKLRYLSTM